MKYIIIQILLLVTGVSVLRAEPPVRNENAGGDKHVSMGSRHMVITAHAHQVLRANRATNKWSVCYNGTCSGAPSLGIYPCYGDAPTDTLEIVSEGQRFFVERTIVGLDTKWGNLVVDRAAYDVNSLAVRVQNENLVFALPDDGSATAEQPDLDEKPNSATNVSSEAKSNGPRRRKEENR